VVAFAKQSLWDIDIRIKELDYDTLRRLYYQFRQVASLFYAIP